jgi:hypothetical protein
MLNSRPLAIKYHYFYCVKTICLARTPRRVCAEIIDNKDRANRDDTIAG